MAQYKRRAVEHKALILGYSAHALHFPKKKPKATLVCFHGWLDNAASFVPLAEELADFEIFAWDFIGHGKSAHRHTGDRYHYIDLVSFIDDALEKTPAEAEVMLLGHSMGAGAVALYAGALGQNLRKTILIEGFAPMTAEPKDAARILAEGVREFKKAAGLPKPIYKSIHDLVKIRMRINGLALDTALPLVKRAAQKVKAGYTWRADFRLRAPSLVRMTHAQVENIVGSIVSETLIILGEKGMPALRKAITSDNKLFKGARVEILPGHHHLHMDNAAEVARLIKKFLE